MKKKTVEVFDRIMGSGKTSAICHWMRDNPDKNYIYISPVLTEVTDRIPQECPELSFITPSTENHSSKKNHILELLYAGDNICTTHALYEILDERHTDAVAMGDYTLVIDEEINFIQPYTRYNQSDIISLEEKDFVKINYDTDGSVDWLWDNIKQGTVYERLKRDCEMGMLYFTKPSEKSDKEYSSMLVTHIPPKLVDVCDRVIILTYMFDGSVMERFFSLRGYETTPFTEVNTYRSQEDIINQIQSLVNFIETPSVKKLRNSQMGDGMSSSWYDRTSPKNREKVGKTISNAARSVKARSDSLVYTMPKRYAIQERPTKNQSKKPVPIDIPRYSQEISFLYSSCRATNAYSDRDTAIHAYNRFPNIAVNKYLHDYGMAVDADIFALSEMIQWLWRTQIRESKPINVAILSRRMDRLFKEWLYNK